MTLTELGDKPVRRRIGQLIVSIEKDGIRVRGFRKRRSVFVPYEAIVKQGMIDDGGYSLTEEEWLHPIDSLMMPPRRKK